MIFQINHGLSDYHLIKQLTNQVIILITTKQSKQTKKNIQRYRHAERTHGCAAELAFRLKRAAAVVTRAPTICTAPAGAHAAGHGLQ